MGEQAARALAGARVGSVPDPTADRSTLSLAPIPAGLRLDRVARSHGWSGLAPFGYDTVTQQLHRVLVVAGPADSTLATAVPVWVGPDWVARSGQVLTPAQAGSVRAQLRWCLGLGDDVQDAPPVVRATRLLRSPTVWEDLTKTLLTTNCSWAATIGMVDRLVDLGTERTFPTPAAVADAGEAALRRDIRVGYRAAALSSLARWVAESPHGPLRWLEPDVSDEMVVEEIQALPGFGRYSAESMLGLLGRPRGLAVDSWIRARLGGAPARDIAEKYAGYGRWAGAVLWQDVTSDWFAG